MNGGQCALLYLGHIKRSGLCFVGDLECDWRPLEPERLGHASAAVARSGNARDSASLIAFEGTSSAGLAGRRDVI